MSDRPGNGPVTFVQFMPEHAPTLYCDGKPVGIVKRLTPMALSAVSSRALWLEDAEHVELHRDPDYGCEDA